MTELEEVAAFAVDVHQDILATAEAVEEGALLPEEFTRWTIGVLAEVGEIDDAVACYFQARGVEASGYAVDEESATLNLLVTRYTGSEPPLTVPRGDVDTAFARLRGFYRRAREGLHRRMEEASPGFDMAQTIHALGPDIRSLRLFFVTDGLTTVERVGNEAEDGVEISHHVWDLRRIQRAITSGNAREPISIDFMARFGSALPCVTAGVGDGEYVAYLAVMPGEVLADIYEEFGPRLLERNVRSFLQLRGKVNKGIRTTILEEPDHFLAYNNGISVTASQLTTADLPDGRMGIAALDDLQIVNGGQTTASIHSARRKDGADLSALAVATKVTVVDPARLEAFVPSITRYANSQNRVNEADFSANDPFHIAIERFSRTVWAPASDGTQRQTRWFYERARGQYADALARERTPGRQRAFRSLHPPSQRFSKTDLAKFENAWASLPHVVSLGAEKNFRDFTVRLADRGRFEVTQDYFHRLIAKAILFRQTQRLVSAQDFGGYRANIVAYTVAYMSQATAQTIDLDAIWRKQGLAPELEQALVAVAHAVRGIITDPPRNGNVTEWSKRKECWDRIRELQVPQVKTLPKHVLAPLDGKRPRSSRTEPLNDYVDPQEAELIARVASVPASTWFELSHWARETSNLSGWQRSIAFSIGKRISNGQKPSRKQAMHGERILSEAERLGFKLSTVET